MEMVEYTKLIFLRKTQLRHVFHCNLKFFFLFSSDFCDTSNKAGISIDEVPGKPYLDYLLLPAQNKQAKSASKGIVVYCIDVSGSMSCTTQIPELQGRYY